MNFGMIIKAKYGKKAKLCYMDTLDVSEAEKAKATKMCVIKRKLIFENYFQMFRSSST